MHQPQFKLPMPYWGTQASRSLPPLMLKRLLVTLLPFLAASCGRASKTAADLRTLDPKEILYSLPTLCDPAPAVDDAAAPAGSLELHEDDWRQIEFVPAANLQYINRELAALAAFKAAHQRGPGWTQVYLRKEHPAPLAALNLQFVSLPKLPETTIALGGRRVRGGFAISQAGEWFLYGQRKPDGGILHLGVSPRHVEPSPQLIHSLMTIAQTAQLLLVDWYAVSLVNTTSIESTLAWARRYQQR